MGIFVCNPSVYLVIFKVRKPAPLGQLCPLPVLFLNQAGIIEVTDNLELLILLVPFE